MNTNTQVQYMKADNNPIVGGYVKVTSPVSYRYVSKEEVARDIENLLPKGGVNSKICKEVVEYIDNPCGCGKIPQKRTVCKECACMPKLPDFEAGTLVEYCDYEELLRVKFPRDTVVINKVVVDGAEQPASEEIKSVKALENYFSGIIGGSEVKYISGKIKIKSPLKLTTFEYTVNGDHNYAIFNQTKCRTVALGANNLYLFEQTIDGTGRWEKYVAPKYNASDISIDKGTVVEGETVLDALEIINEKVTTAVGTANNALSKVDGAVAKAEQAISLANEAQKTADKNAEKIIDIKNEITGHDARLTEIEKEQSRQDVDIAQHETEITKLQELVKQQGNYITALEHKLGTFEARLQEAERKIASNVVNKFSETYQLTANTPYEVTHNLNDEDVNVSAFDASGNKVELQYTNRTADTITVTSTETGYFDIVIQK